MAGTCLHTKADDPHTLSMDKAPQHAGTTPIHSNGIVVGFTFLTCLFYHPFPTLTPTNRGGVPLMQNRDQCRKP